MKIILKLIILILLAIGVGRVSGQGFEVNRADLKLYHFWSGSDTIQESIDTLIVEYPNTLDDADWKLIFTATADSLDGDQTGAAYLQASYAVDDPSWVDLDTLTFAGEGTYTTSYSHVSTSPFMYNKLRLYTVTTDTLGTLRLTSATLLLKR